MMKPTRVLWIDLDGTVRKGKGETGRFVHGPEDVEIFDGVPRILRAYKERDWRIVGVTNQGGVALGFMSKNDCAAAIERTNVLCDRLFDRIIVCMHHPDADDPLMANCWCRKPRIGGMVQAGCEMSANHGEIYPPHMGLFVGDRPEDEQCAANAGIGFMSAKDWRMSPSHPA